MKMNRILILLISCALFSCETSKKIVYMQDAKQGDIDTLTVYQGIKIQPKDILSIVVFSRNQELAKGFNLPMVSYQAGNPSSSISFSSRLLDYLVDMEGNIDYPYFGKLKVAGLTRDQLSDMIKQKLISEGLIRDPIVTTEFMNLKISVLGEVRTPGTFTLTNDRITLLEALSRVGDMTIYGRRDNVLVRREQNGEIYSYRVDLLSTEFIHSPVYYLQQNDVVYVEPNATIAARSRINENRTLGAGISLVSLLTNIVMSIVLLSK